MPWVRLDDAFPEHPKVARVGGDAAWLHVCALAYCNRNLTDGFVPSRAVRQLSDRRNPLKLAMALADAELWHRVEGGFEINDYLEYQPSRAEIEAERAKKNEQKVAAGKLGGIASGVSRRKHKRSSGEADGKQTRSETEAPTRPDPTRFSPVVGKETDTTPDGSSSSPFDDTVTLYADRIKAKPRNLNRDQDWFEGVMFNCRKEHGSTILLALAKGAAPAQIADSLVYGTELEYPEAEPPPPHPVSCHCEGEGNGTSQAEVHWEHGGKWFSARCPGPGEPHPKDRGLRVVSGGAA